MEKGPTMVDENDEGNSLPVRPLPRIQGENKKGGRKKQEVLTL